jgi:hypothetical protein
MPKFTDRRRKHEHWQAVITYKSGGQFARTYLSKEKAEAFARRSMRSPVVIRTRVSEVNAH